MNQIYTVKDAARILGFSTNTVYKYLNEGRLKAARGDLEAGRFRIPHQAIEEFLGTEIPTDILDHLRQTPEIPDSEISTNPTTSTLTSYAPPPVSLPITAVRMLIVFSLFLIIIDIIMSPSISLLGQLTRIAVIGIFMLIAYQYKGDKLPDESPTDPLTTFDQRPQNS